VLKGMHKQNNIPFTNYRRFKQSQNIEI